MIFKKNTNPPRRPARRMVPRKTLHARAASSREEIEEYESEAEPSMKLSQAFLVVLALHVIAVAGIYGFNQLKEKPARAATPKTEATENAAPVTVAEKKQEPAAKSEPAKEQESQATYTVVAGDTLRRISTKLNTSIEKLEKANNLTSTSILKVGQVLAVSGSAKTATAAPQTAETTAKATSTPSVAGKAPQTKAAPVAEKTDAAPADKSQTNSEKTYIVAKGDNPYSLAKKFNITQAALMKANNIDDPKKLKIGQKLIIP